MVDENEQQNIDQQVSNSPIDQITKVATSKPKAKVKNPKRVAAGKKLSQYNKKARQSRDAVVKEEQQKMFKKMMKEKKSIITMIINGYLKHHLHQSSRCSV